MITGLKKFHTRDSINDICYTDDKDKIFILVTEFGGRIKFFQYDCVYYTIVDLSYDSQNFILFDSSITTKTKSSLFKIVDNPSFQLSYYYFLVANYGKYFDENEAVALIKSNRFHIPNITSYSSLHKRIFSGNYNEEFQQFILDNKDCFHGISFIDFISCIKNPISEIKDIMKVISL